MYTCAVCNKGFSRKDNFKRHLKQKHPDVPVEDETPTNEYSCDVCGKSFRYQGNLRKHQKIHSTSRWSCGICGVSTDSKEQLFEHEKRFHNANPPGPSNPADVNREDPVQCPTDVENLWNDCEEEELECLRQHWSSIRTHTIHQKLTDIYNERISNLTDLKEIIQSIFEQQTSAFKLNLSFGFLLRNSETGEVRYYYPSQNGFVFQEPLLIANHEDLENLLKKVADTDWLEYIRKQKPNSKWRVSLTCSVGIYVYKLPEMPIGRGGFFLPSFIVENRGVDGLEKNHQTGKPYQDHLCYFRCVARHKGFEVKNLERKTKALKAQYFQTLTDNEVRGFEGVTLSDLHRLDEIFGIHTYVYALELPTPGCKHPVARLVHRPRKILTKAESEKALKLNIYGNHFSYIKNMEKFSKCYECARCTKIFKRCFNLQRHEVKCDARVKFVYPGGVYTPPKSIYDKLEEEGIQVPEDLKYSKYFGTFDIEVYYPKCELPAKRPKLEFTAQHQLLSVSVASNIPGYLDPKCLIVGGPSEEDAKETVNQLISYLNEISDTAYQLEQKRYESLKQLIAETIKSDPSEQPYVSEEDMEDCHGGYDNDSEEEEEEEHSATHALSITDQRSKRKTLAQKLIDELDEQLRELTVIGFHSGTYDLNVLKRFLIPYMVKNGGVKFCVKRNQSYLALRTEKLKFLDISNFLAAGSSYAGFLKAYGCAENKGFFPYEWVDSLEKLEESQLPPHSAFYSSLKNTNIAEEEYFYCQEVWEKEGMQTMRDFLTWYNNLDVGPFIEALDKMKAFWQGYGIDIFNFISLPGIAMRFEMSFLKEQGIHLSVFNSEELYNLFRGGMVGGPAIIFKRYAEADKTYIRNNPDKLCQNIIGYDANALYLWALAQPMPVGLYTHWQYAGEKFQPLYPWREADEWLAWASHQRGTTLRTRLNNTEKRLGDRQLPVDGFDPSTGAAYQYMGCYWHGCPSCFDPEDPHPTRGETYGYWYEKTKENIAYLEEIGYSPIVEWGCQWLQEKRDNPEIHRYLNSHFPGRDQKLKSPTQLLDEVRNGTLFGAVEVDLHVPNDLKPKFEEMSPIFKNVDISIDNIGEHMKEFAEEHECMPRPRRSLIGSYKAEKILLATPLLQFYLEQGLVVTKVHQAVQWCSRPCLAPFGEFVTTARRNGDQGGSQVVAETAKTVGNAGYGRFLMDSSRHLDIKYEEDESKVCRAINSLFFRDLEEIDDGVYELKSAKKRIKMNLPIQIGFFVYQYAKLRMLEFFYHCFDHFLDRSDFELLEMDTDSLYMAIAGDSVEELVKPERKAEFEATKSSWFPRTDSPEHTAYDKRTPGLFKVEWRGDGFVGLNSKTYYCWGQDGDKYSCKGVNKKRNSINKDKYLKVLMTGEPESGENRGFRVVKNKVLTYSQFRLGFSYFYPKRQVLSDGITTIPLDI